MMASPKRKALKQAVTTNKQSNKKKLSSSIVIRAWMGSIVSIARIVSNEDMIRLLALLLSNVSRVCIACTVITVSSVSIGWYSM